MKLQIHKILSFNSFKAASYVLMLAVCIYYFFINIMIIRTTPSENLIDPASPFASFTETLKNVPEAGYLTNKNMSEEGNDGLYLMAQFGLAPTILRLNEIDPKYNILDYTAPVYFILSLRSLKATLVQTSSYGVALTERAP